MVHRDSVQGMFPEGIWLQRNRALGVGTLGYSTRRFAFWLNPCPVQDMGPVTTCPDAPIQGNGRTVTQSAFRSV